MGQPQPQPEPTVIPDWEREYLEQEAADPADARTMERAAQIIAERSTKPGSISTRVLIKVLTRQAAAIRRERRPAP
jgi:hypothetical protein